jgi:multidrug efflux pump
MRGLENDVYFQVGLLTVIGLSAKNAILIVEFANELNEKGEDLLAATLSACRQRLRPILMTSLAFILASCRWRPAPAPVPAASMPSAPG